MKCPVCDKKIEHLDMRVEVAVYPEENWRHGEMARSYHCPSCKHILEEPEIKEIRQQVVTALLSKGGDN